MTADKITKDIIENLPSHIDAREGTVTRDIIEAVAKGVSKTLESMKREERWRDL